jgi:hypothetical protein
MSTVTDNEKIDTVKELIDYVAEHGEEVTTIVSKLDTIEEGAQVNTIESIKIGDTVLDATEKAVTIPVATANNYGVVKSTTGANKVNINSDGTMSVNKVDINSIVVPKDEEVVLNGGNAAGATLQAYAVSIGNYGFPSIEKALNCADNGDTIALQNDLINAGDANNLVVNADNVTLDLNGHTYSASGSNGAIQVLGGTTVLTGDGKVNADLGSDNYSMAVWAKGGKVVINGGTYTNATDFSDRGTDLIYASENGVIEINGGTFEASRPEWTLNVKDADYKAGTANIIVKGGSFKNFDPANNKAEGPGTNFVALGYESIKEGDYYVVKPL